MCAVWPTPTGLGAAVIFAYVGMFQGGVCALMFCTNIVDADIDNTRTNAITMDSFLPYCIFILLKVF